MYACMCRMHTDISKPETFQHISANVNCESFCNCVARNPICLIQFRKDKDLILFSFGFCFGYSGSCLLCFNSCVYEMGEWVSFCVCVLPLPKKCVENRKESPAGKERLHRTDEHKKKKLCRRVVRLLTLWTNEDFATKKMSTMKAEER